jgi:hypothetical protein
MQDELAHQAGILGKNYTKSKPAGNETRQELIAAICHLEETMELCTREIDKN